MITTYRSALLVALLAASLGCSPPSGADDVTRYALPKKLIEVSGLALLSGSSVLAVGDEKAWVYQIDVRTGEVERRVKLGNPVLRGDFEGITVHGTTLFLVTSDGTLYSGAWPAEGERAAFRAQETALGKQCEVEGLTVYMDQLVFACKTARAKSLKGKVTLFASALNPVAPEMFLSIDEAELTSRTNTKRFNPSAVTPLGDGSLLLLAARQEAFAMVRRDGTILRAGRLPDKSAHPQTEGAVALADGSIVLADEGGKDRGVLSVYPNGF